MAYRMRVRRGAMSRLRRKGYRRPAPLRLPARQAKRLKAIAKADRYGFTTSWLGVTSYGDSSDSKNSLTQLWSIFQNDNEKDEVFTISRYRMDFQATFFLSAARATSATQSPAGVAAVWIALFDTKDTEIVKNATQRKEFIEHKVDYFDPLSQTDRQSRRGVRLLRYKELWSPYVPKLPNAGRPDAVMRYVLRLPGGVRIRPGQMLVTGITSSRHYGSTEEDRIDYHLVERCQSTSGDITDKNQAPTYVDATSIEIKAARDANATWFSLT